MEKKQDPELKEFVRGNVPLVFMFQPTHYQEVQGDKLQQWEKDLIEKVGLSGVKNIDTMALRNPTWCKCNPYDPLFDDCDQL